MAPPMCDASQGAGVRDGFPEEGSLELRPGGEGARRWEIGVESEPTGCGLGGSCRNSSLGLLPCDWF